MISWEETMALKGTQERIQNTDTQQERERWARYWLEQLITASCRNNLESKHKRGTAEVGEISAFKHRFVSV